MRHIEREYVPAASFDEDGDRYSILIRKESPPPEPDTLTAGRASLSEVLRLSDSRRTRCARDRKHHPRRSASGGTASHEKSSHTVRSSS